MHFGTGKQGIHGLFRLPGRLGNLPGSRGLRWPGSRVEVLVLSHVVSGDDPLERVVFGAGM